MNTLVLQRGHVPRTSGATGGPGEQAMARRVAEAIAGLMPHAGWRLRIIDAYEPSWRYRGDAFVALHGDAHSSPSVGGASVGYRTPEGKALARRWKDAYARHGWPWDFRSDNYTAALAGYYGHRHAVNEGNRTAVIVEHGFMTNPAERAWIDSPDGTRAAALAVVEAVTGSTPVSEPSTGEAMFVRHGDEGEAVEYIQLLLADVGHPPVGGADGDFGDKTADAISAYWRDRHGSDYHGREVTAHVLRALQADALGGQATAVASSGLSSGDQSYLATFVAEGRKREAQPPALWHALDWLRSTRDHFSRYS